jgi:hypothetical protein
MLQIDKKYRKDYTGEDIIVERKHEGKKWWDQTETIPNMITNNQISNRAAIIGNGPSRLEFNLQNLKKPQGLLGATTVQTYGCNALYRDFTPDFLISTGNNGIVTEIANSDYVNNNIVYSNAIHLLEHPSKFYLIPYDPYADAGTTAAYIAAFDGHTTIYLIGFDGYDLQGHNSNIYADTNGYDLKWQFEVEGDKLINNRAQLFNTYSDVDFVWVTSYGKNTVPETLKWCSNHRQISFRDLVLECDL